jgi:hypothetical protein
MVASSGNLLNGYENNEFLSQPAPLKMLFLQLLLLKIFPRDTSVTFATEYLPYTSTYSTLILVFYTLCVRGCKEQQRMELLHVIKQ